MATTNYIMTFVDAKALAAHATTTATPLFADAPIAILELMDAGIGTITTCATTTFNAGDTLSIVADETNFLSSIELGALSKYGSSSTNPVIRYITL